MSFEKAFFFFEKISLRDAAGDVRLKVINKHHFFFLLVFATILFRALFALLDINRPKITDRGGHHIRTESSIRQEDRSVLNMVNT